MHNGVNKNKLIAHTDIIMIQQIFFAVANILFKTAQKLNITYNQINVIVYYLFIPLSWTIMLDLKIRLPITTSVLLCIWIGIFIATRRYFKEWCDWVFEDSVRFLNFFNRWGGNYELNSVIICVAIPLIIYLGLILLLII